MKPAKINEIIDEGIIKIQDTPAHFKYIFTSMMQLGSPIINGSKT